MKIKNSIKISLIIVIVLNIALIAGNFFVFSYVKNLQEDVIKLNKENIDKNLVTGRFFKIRKQVESTKTEQEKINSYFIEGNEETIRFLEEIEGIAKKLSLPIEISIDAETVSFDKNLSLDALNLSINTEGEFAELYQLLKLFENLPYKVVLNNVSLKRDGSKTKVVKNSTTSESQIQLPVWNMSLSLRLISFKK